MQKASFLLLVSLACLVAVSYQIDCSNNLWVRSYDGSCNNLIDPLLGVSGAFYRRGPEGAEYNPDGTPVNNRPVERVISNKIARPDPTLRDSIRHSLFATQFGQFVNHDLDNNRFADPDSINYPDKLSIPEKDDSFCYIFADLLHGNFTMINACLPPLNQNPISSTKVSATAVVDGVPQVYNDANSWLDLHTIYGTSAAVNSALRTHVGGKLLTNNYSGTTSPANTFNFFQFGFGPVPLTCTDCPPSFAQTNGQVPVNPLLNPQLVHSIPAGNVFVSGDPRVGENAALTMFHTLFIRNHNRHATRIAAAHPNWNDEQVFQAARRRNIAEYQAIVLYQYLPTEFGQFFADMIGDYEAYNPYVDAEVNVVFSSAAFRYGHSSFRNYVPRDACANPTMFNQPAQGSLLAFGGQTGGPITPLDVIGEVGTFENVIRALIFEPTAPNDHMIDDALRDLPFTFPFAGGTDILALDFHRARLNGVPNYVRLQQYYGRKSDRVYGANGCPAVNSRTSDPDPLGCFTRLVGNTNSTLAQNLQALYGKVNRIDPILGLLLERKVDGTSFGYTLGSIIVDTYKRARDGDRFWFENPLQPNAFSENKIEKLKRTNIGDLLYANFNFPSRAQVPSNPFLSPYNYGSTLSRTCGVNNG